MVKKGIRLKITVVLVFLTVLVAGLGFKTITVSAKASEENGWQLRARGNDSYSITVDESIKYGDSAYSLRITNTDYNLVSVKKTFKLKPNTQYRASVMVRYSDYEAKPEEGASAWGEGAQLRASVAGNTFYQESYEGVKGNVDKWTKEELKFQTDESGECEIQLLNGGYCKGNAWFSGFRLEEVAETTNQWNILVVIIKSIDTDVMVNGKKSHYTGSYSKEDIAFLKDNLPGELKKQLTKVSDGLIGVNDVDIYAPDIVLKEVNLSDPNAVNPYNEVLSKKLDDYLEKKAYQQIIVIPPFSYGINDWQGKGGNKYKGINFCQYIHYPGDRVFYGVKGYEDYQISGYIHEILHGVEHDSKAIDGDKTPDFHENVGIYKDYYDDKTDGWFKYHHDYITGNLPDGMGIDQSVLYRPSMYLLVSDDLTPLRDIEVKGTLPTHISEVVTVGKVKSVTYKGKALKPSVKVTGAEKGTDYTISYKNNNDIGKGKVIIKGKGKYTGTIEVSFIIKIKTPTLKVKGSKLKWSKISGADGYEIYVSKDGGKYKKLTEVTKNQYSLKDFKTGSYTFKVRAYARTNCGLEYGSWSKELTVVFK